MIDEEDISVETRIKLQTVLTETQAFLSSSAYAFYVEARLREIEILRDNIISLDPKSREDEIESFKMRGELRLQQEFVSLFEDVAVSLADRIEQLLEAEQPNSNK